MTIIDPYLNLYIKIVNCKISYIIKSRFIIFHLREISQDFNDEVVFD
jgi:hypothetical protein